jgi:cytochrome c-type biogenesis protein CcmH/NrfG
MATPVPRSQGQRFKVIGIVLIVVLLGAWGAMHLLSPVADAPLALVAVPVASQPVQLPTVSVPESVATVEETTRVPSPLVVEPRQVRRRARTTSNRTPDPGARILNPVPPLTSSPPQSPGPGSRIPDPGSRIPDPGPGVDHFALALRYHNLGDFERAREHYIAALRDDEFNLEARNNLALLYHSRGMTDEAVEEFRRALRVDPRYTRARSNLAVVLTSAGRLAEARAELRSALQAEPRNVDLLVNMALVEKADKHPEQAMELLVRAVGTSPGHAVAHYNLAALYEERESLALAYDHYNTFLKYAGPEHGDRLTDVQRRVRLLEPKLQKATN